MDWFIINGISAGLAAVSLGVFVITTRKLASTIRLGRELGRQVQLATKSLDHAVKALREEHQDFRDENRKLDARIGESTRVRRDVDRSIAHMEAMHNQLQRNLHQLNTAMTHTMQQDNRTNPAKIQAAIQPRRHEKSLPVFVQRTVSKATLNNGNKF